ncbi:hypothetical protein EDD11_008698 [Mortierella claussenii]|nr:hypothetical protein EDD11_008698 [Mortierella claussenii]
MFLDGLLSAGLIGTALETWYLSEHWGKTGESPMKFLRRFLFRVPIAIPVSSGPQAANPGTHRITFPNDDNPQHIVDIDELRPLLPNDQQQQLYLLPDEEQDLQTDQGLSVHE